MKVLKYFLSFFIINLRRENANTLPVERLANFYQGDIVLPPSNVSNRGVAIRPKDVYRWPDGIVFYEIAENISRSNAIYIVQMMREIERLTSVNGTRCVSFEPKNSSNLIFITIFNGTGCYAPIGTWGPWRGTRPVSLMSSPYGTCMYSGIIQHELTHVLGMFHEQSRPDRDDFISINWDNIDPEQKFNFDKYTDDQVDTQMTSYDYGSVMHYDRYAFALNSTVPTIKPTRNSSAFIGQRIGLSSIDIIEIQRYYDCIPTTLPLKSTQTTTTSTTVQTISTRHNFSHSVFHSFHSFVYFLCICFFFFWNH